MSEIAFSTSTNAFPALRILNCLHLCCPGIILQVIVLLNPCILNMNRSELKSKDWKSWCQPYGIDLVVLFGSQAKGTTRAQSDIDIAVFSVHTKLRPLILKLYGALEDFLGQEADLVVIDGLTDSVLRFEVFRYGQCLYEAEPGLFFQQKIAAYRIYEDTEYIRRFRDKVLAERIRNL